MAIVGTCLLVMLFCPITSLMRDTSACVSNTGMRNYVSRDVILEVREGWLCGWWLDVDPMNPADFEGYPVFDVIW
jgi:hypothetical protein